MFPHLLVLVFLTTATFFSENDKKTYKIFSTEPEGKSTGGVGTQRGRAALLLSLTTQETSRFWRCRVWDMAVPHGCKAYIKRNRRRPTLALSRSVWT